MLFVPHHPLDHLKGTKGLVINYRDGGLQNEGGGASEILLLERGAEKVLDRKRFSHAKISFEVILTQELKVLAILMGEAKQKVSTL